MIRPSQVSTARMPHLEGVSHRHLDLPGLRMHVAEAGSGAPVLLLHGFPQHWWEWREVIPGLASRYRVICPDLRGAGWSDAPAEGYDAAHLAADVLALLDALDVDRVHLIGHDWGALLGFQLSIDHPGRIIDHLAIAVPHPFIRFSPSMLRGVWRLWFQPVIATPGLGPWLLGGSRQRLARHLLKAFSADSLAWGDGDVDSFAGQFRDPARARAASALYRSYILKQARLILAGTYRDTHLSTPTRLLLGAEDTSMQPDLLAGFEPYADDLSIEWIDGAAHFLADERPDAVVAAARRLFGSDID